VTIKAAPETALPRARVAGMQAHEYSFRIEDIKRRAHGHWTEILARLGVGDGILRMKNGPCPLCGGTDRFQYTDKFGEGNYFCRGCGPGGGFKLLQAVKGCDFNTALSEVEQQVGTTLKAVNHPATGITAQRLEKLAVKLWSEGRPVQAGDEVSRYLEGRGLFLSSFPEALRLHPALGYFERDDFGRNRKVAEYPAMLAVVQGHDGLAVTVHRTYLMNGRKILSRDARKVLSAGITGAAVRLHEATEELAICEGIETGLAVHLGTGKPVWSGLSAGNLEKLWLPEGVRRVWVYADNDADGDFAGQACAYALARRLRREQVQGMAREVRVFLPRTPGLDWADVWERRSARRSARRDRRVASGWHPARSAHW
jgi:putative DNA primase/helicase